MNGFRGAVLLGPGDFEIAGQVKITASGVVLRGSGRDPASGSATRLIATGTSTRDVIAIGGVNAAENVFIRQIEARHFPYAATTVHDDGKFVTTSQARSLLPSGTITGSRRYTYNVDGQLSLVIDATASEGRHDFVTGSDVAGPSAFVSGTATNWLIGSVGTLVTEGGKIGTYDSLGTRVSLGDAANNPTDSLYRAQLLERRTSGVDLRFQVGDQGTTWTGGSGGALRSLPGTSVVASGSGRLVLGSGSTGIGVDAGVLTIARTISGTGGLAKTGSRRLVLTAANSYVGGTTLLAGTLEASSSAALASGSAVGRIIVVGGTLTLPAAAAGPVARRRGPMRSGRFRVKV